MKKDKEEGGEGIYAPSWLTRCCGDLLHNPSLEGCGKSKQRPQGPTWRIVPLAAWQCQQVSATMIELGEDRLAPISPRDEFKPSSNEIDVEWRVNGPKFKASNG